jgi:hypothetical protein
VERERKKQQGEGGERKKQRGQKRGVGVQKRSGGAKKETARGWRMVKAREGQERNGSLRGVQVGSRTLQHYYIARLLSSLALV